MPGKVQVTVMEGKDYKTIKPKEYPKLPETNTEKNKSSQDQIPWAKRSAILKKLFKYRESDLKEAMTNPDKKPKLSYGCMIWLALKNLPREEAFLINIYDYIMDTFPYYGRQVANKNGWQNSIRHNLSLNKAFIKCGKAEHRGNLWAIDPECETFNTQVESLEGETPWRKKKSSSVDESTVDRSELEHMEIEIDQIESGLVEIKEEVLE